MHPWSACFRRERRTRGGIKRLSLHNIRCGSSIFIITECAFDFSFLPFPPFFSSGTFSSSHILHTHLTSTRSINGDSVFLLGHGCWTFFFFSPIFSRPILRYLEICTCYDYSVYTATSSWNSLLCIVESGNLDCGTFVIDPLLNNEIILLLIEVVLSEVVYFLYSFEYFY